jgi:hypothetical protein
MATELRMPGFTAEVSLCGSKHHYRSAGESWPMSAGPSVAAALIDVDWCFLSFTWCLSECRSDWHWGDFGCPDDCNRMYAECSCHQSGGEACSQSCCPAGWLCIDGFCSCPLPCGDPLQCWSTGLDMPPRLFTSPQQSDQLLRGGR